MRKFSMQPNLSSHEFLDLVIIVRPTLLYILELFPTYYRPLTDITDLCRYTNLLPSTIMHNWQDNETEKSSEYRRRNGARLKTPDWRDGGPR